MNAITAGLNHDLWSFTDLVLKTHFARAIAQGSASYPVSRPLRFAAARLSSRRTCPTSATSTMRWCGRAGASKRSSAVNRLRERAQKSYSLASVYQAAGR